MWTVNSSQTGSMFRCHFGSSHFLFERAQCFSRSRAFVVLSCPSVYNPVLQFPTLSHGTCERRNRCAGISGTSFLFENVGSTNCIASTMEEKINEMFIQIAATHAERIQIRKLSPDAFSYSGLVRCQNLEY